MAHFFFFSHTHYLISSSLHSLGNFKQGQMVPAFDKVLSTVVSSVVSMANDHSISLNPRPIFCSLMVISRWMVTSFITCTRYYPITTPTRFPPVTLVNNVVFADHVDIVSTPTLTLAKPLALALALALTLTLIDPYP